MNLVDKARLPCGTAVHLRRKVSKNSRYNYETNCLESKLVRVETPALHASVAKVGIMAPGSHFSTKRARNIFFGGDRTAGLVDPKGYLVIQHKDGKTRVKTPYESGIHPGERHPEAGGAADKKEETVEDDKPVPFIQAPSKVARGEGSIKESQEARLGPA